MAGEYVPPGDGAPLRVLIAEDSAILAERLAELVEGLPRTDLVAMVDTEGDAIRHLGQSSPDVIVLDLHLRKGTGFGVLSALHGATHPKVIVLSNYGLPEYRRAAEALGAYAFLDTVRDYRRLGPLLLSFTNGRRAAHERST